jgi:curli biogenesis system outer membrane secretion channel CsgG
MNRREKMRIVAVFLSTVICALLISGCATPPDPYDRTSAIAVWDLENLSPTGSPTQDLGGILSGEVIEAVREKGYPVVERERLLLALEELRLGTSALADESTGLRLGRLVGARLMVFGGYQVIEDKMRLDLRVVEVETGRVVKSSQRIVSSVDLSQWLTAAREAALEIL